MIASLSSSSGRRSSPKRLSNIVCTPPGRLVGHLLDRPQCPTDPCAKCQVSADKQQNGQDNGCRGRVLPRRLIGSKRDGCDHGSDLLGAVVDGLRVPAHPLRPGGLIEQLPTVRQAHCLGVEVLAVYRALNDLGTVEDPGPDVQGRVIGCRSNDEGAIGLDLDSGCGFLRNRAEEVLGLAIQPVGDDEVDTHSDDDHPAGQDCNRRQSNTITQASWSPPVTQGLSRRTRYPNPCTVIKRGPSVRPASFRRIRATY